MEKLTNEELLEIRALLAEQECAKLKHDVARMRLEYVDLLLKRKYNLSEEDKIDAATGQITRHTKE